MDYQHRVGGKTGTGGVASASESNRDRRERLRQLALETIDLQKDPYFMRNHLGSYECKLCLTLHNNEGSYLAHTQGKKHQSNLARRAAKDAKDSNNLMPQLASKSRVDVRKFVKIGRPGYRITKQLDPSINQQSLLFQIDYPEIADNIIPRHRFMSAYEQKIEPPDRRWQYVLFAAEPYETIAFKVPSREVDKSEGKFWTLWNKDSKQFFLQFAFREGVTMQTMGGISNLNSNNQNFISQNNKIEKTVSAADAHEKAEREAANQNEELNNQLNEFNIELNEQLDENADEQQFNENSNGQFNENSNGQFNENSNEQFNENSNEQLEENQQEGNREENYDGQEYFEQEEQQEHEDYEAEAQHYLQGDYGQNQQQNFGDQNYGEQNDQNYNDENYQQNYAEENDENMPESRDD